MTRPAIRLRIGRDGRVEAETIGLAGESCLDIVPLVEDLAAARVVSSRYRPEFFTSSASASNDATAEEPDVVPEGDVRHDPDQDCP